MAKPAEEDAPSDKKEKKPEVVPGAELDPIAIEPERELSAEEKARQEAEAEERARRERELIGEATEESPVAAKPAKLVRRRPLPRNRQAQVLGGASDPDAG